MFNSSHLFELGKNNAKINNEDTRTILQNKLLPKSLPKTLEQRLWRLFYWFCRYFEQVFGEYNGEHCSKLAVNTQEGLKWQCSTVLIINFDQILAIINEKGNYQLFAIFNYLHIHMQKQLREVFHKKGVLKNFRKVQRKTPVSEPRF